MKTDINILEGNKLIAEFMGLEIITDGISWFDTNYKSLGNYDSSWNLMMSVVEKIENLEVNSVQVVDEFRIEPNQVVVRGWITPKHKFYRVYEIEKMSSIFKLKAVWFVVVEFIKWYNLNKY